MALIGHTVAAPGLFSHRLAPGRTTGYHLAFQVLFFHGQMQAFFNPVQPLQIFHRIQGDSHTIPAGAASPAHPVDIPVHAVRNIIVNNMGNAFHIQTPGCDIAGNQDLQLGRAEVFHHRLTFSGAHGPRQHVHIVPVLTQVFTQSLRPFLADTENQHQIRVQPVNQLGHR